MQSHSTGIRNLNLSAYMNLKISFPPLQEQRRIVDILDKAFAAIAIAKVNAERNVENAGEIFESRLNSIFMNGKKQWKSFSVSELGEVITGSTPPTSDKENYGDYIPFIKPGDFLPDGSLCYNNGGLSEQGSSRSRIVKKGSVSMVCIGATIGKCGYNTRKITTNQQINSLIPKAIARQKFLYYQMCTRAFQNKIRAGAGQATLPIINKSKWSALALHIPNVEIEQDTISDQLDLLYHELGLFRENLWYKIAKLEELKLSLLHQAFTGAL